MSLVSYAKMKAHYESVKPIRGTDIKPFMQRRRKWEHMKLLSNGDIQIICHNTPVLTIHTDNSFSVCHGGWVTPTTSCFIDYAIRQMNWRGPLQVALKYKNQLWLSQWLEKQYPENNGWAYLPITKEPIRYTYNPEKYQYQPDTNPKVIKTRKRVDKDKWKEVKHQCREFLQWFDAFGKLLDGGHLSYEGVRLGYTTKVCLVRPSILREEHHWAAKEAKPVLTAIFTEGEEEDYMQVLWELEGQDEFSYKKRKVKINNILKNLFDVYYDVEEEVVYTLDRETKW